MEYSSRSALSLLCVAGIAAGAVAACSPKSGTQLNGGGQGGGGHGSGGVGGATGLGGGLVLVDGGLDGGGVTVVHPVGPFHDFPATPFSIGSDGTALDAGTTDGGTFPPTNAADLFGPAGSGDMGGPCLIDPEPGTLFPNNWVRPRFHWVAAAADQNLFELRIHAKDEVDDLVVYTTGTQWTMPRDMWLAITQNLQEAPMTVTIRGLSVSGGMASGKPKVGTTGDITIAPVAAEGSIVYWRTVDTGQTGELKGFSAGDESVVMALRSSDVKAQPGGKSVACLGCHTSTPDGKYAGFSTMNYFASTASVGGALASIESATVGAAPSFWTPASISAMNSTDFGAPAFSKMHWRDGDYTLLTSWGNTTGYGTTAATMAELAWFDLQATSSAKGTAYGILQRDGDPRGAIMPAFTHDGAKVVYMSTDGSQDGHLPQNTSAVQTSDIYVVPYGKRAGGAATPLVGASDPALLEYYPAVSPDDQFVAFNRVPTGQQTYSGASAEVFVVPLAGGTAKRLAANDPIACSNAKSPGITNSWPKWAPEALSVNGKRYYWIAFSSRRGGDRPQLYLTALVVNGTELETFPGLYIWPQPADESNHTPAWDVFQIPPPPPPQ